MTDFNSILDYFLKWESSTPEAIFLRQPNGIKWINYSWSQVGYKARKIANALKSKGFQPGDRIALLSSNCADWIICDIGIMMGGFVSVPLYANVNALTMREILKQSGTQLMFIGKLLSNDWDNLKDEIPDHVEGVTMNGYDKTGLTNWGQFLKNQDEIGRDNVITNDEQTIIYTSGTTGAPKGVVHTNKSILNAVIAAADEVLLNRKGNRFLSYLPLSHAAERGLIEAGAIYCGGTIGFVESKESFASNVRAIEPTHFFGVPRIWEKFQAKILEKIPQKKLNFLLRIPFLSRLIKYRIVKSLGLHKSIVILSGAAALSADLIYWFHNISISIREAYGMSENFNVISMNPQNDIRPGTVGKLFDNQEVVIDSKTKEIKQKCNWLMQGYYNDPNLTSKTIVNGFLHTGDMGRLSEDGFLTLIGRVKDIFKTSKGEYITPGIIEMEFLNSTIVDQACVMGSNYAQPFILIGLSQVGKEIEKKSLKDQLNTILERVNHDAMQYQKLKKVIIVKEEWTNENGLLTPTLKMKRTILSNKYEPILSEVYKVDETVSWE